MASRSHTARHRQPLTSDEVHLSSKVSKDLSRDVATMRAKLADLSFGPLDPVLGLVSPSMLQHIPPEVYRFRTYLPRFSRGCSTVLGFVKWYEWASFEAAKHGKYHAGSSMADKADLKEPKTEMGKIAKERTHMRALLTMCHRHNSHKRREGLHALVNHLGQHLAEVPVCHSIDDVKTHAHHSVAYALQRLVLGMATDNFANAVLHCHALYTVLAKCPTIEAGVILSLLDVEMALPARTHALEQRWARAGKGSADADADDDAAAFGIDPDELADATKGERNQKTMATILALAALCATGRSLKPEQQQYAARVLCYSYIVHKGLRVTAAGLLLRVVADDDALKAVLSDDLVRQWVQQTFFKFPKMDYLRPEGVQLLVRIADAHSDGAVSKKLLPESVAAWLPLDPLEPSALERVAAALFRKEQATEVHPMVHPVWTQLLALMERRAACGEAITVHISNFINNVVQPFRRGAQDVPRQALFQSLVHSIGQLGLKAASEQERAQVVAEAAAVGFGKRRALGKSSTPQELKVMSIAALSEKVLSLVRQYEATWNDTVHVARPVRTWVLRELKACLAVDVREGIATPYVDTAARALFRFAFEALPKPDTFNQQKAIFTFAELVTAPTHRAAPNARARPRCQVPLEEFAEELLKLEAAKKTVFTTATKGPFKVAREALQAVLSPDATRSVLFFENADMKNLLFLLFLIVSTDDPGNETAVGLAESTVLDLCGFYQSGTLETVEVLYDVLMSIAMRPVGASQIQPLMAAARRLVVIMLTKYARFIKTRAALDMALAPLVEAYGTEVREMQRQLLQRKAADSDDEAADSDEEPAEEDEDAEVEGEAAEGEESGEESDDDATVADDATEPDEQADDAAEGEEEEEEEEEDNESDAGFDEMMDADDDESWASEGEDEDGPDDAEYLQRLKTMLGGEEEAELHRYPPDVAAHEKGDTVRAITIATRVGLGLRCPLVLHVFQVLLAVLRENVKVQDEVVFNAARSSIEMLLLSRQRYFGHFLTANSETLIMLLADVQSYCRKMEKALIQKKKTDEDGGRTANYRALVRRRLAQVKQLALTVFHYAAFLAQKNHATEDVRAVFVEFYRTIFADRGWDHKQRLPQIQRDMFHYRHGFAWCLLDACVDRFAKSRFVDSARRATTFRCCCDMICAFLPRFKGLPAPLKERAASAVKSFITLMPLADLFAMKHTVLYEYFRCLKFCVEYQSKLDLDQQWLLDVVAAVTDDDDILITSATARVVAKIERLLGLTPRVLETKACVPQMLLHKQHATPWRDEMKKKRIQSAKQRERVQAVVLTKRNKEPSFQERLDRKERRRDLRSRDKNARETLRKEHLSSLTQEERKERRARAQQAKQDRISKNSQRKKQLHTKREVAFKEWRKAKLRAAADRE